MTDIQIAAAAELELRRRRRERLSNYETQREYYSSNPLDYLVERLGFRKESIDWTLLPEYENHKWDGTINPLKTLLDCLAIGQRRIGIESGTGTGKTKIAAGIVLWFLDCFDNALIVTTAPKKEQLSLHIWKEIGKLHDQFGKGELISLKLRMNPPKDDYIAVGFVAGTSADEDSATKAQGFHAEHMLIIMEETPGIPQPIITAFQNTADAPHNIILALGNPDHQLDSLHKFCTLPTTTHIRISSLDHPNVVLKNSSFIPGAATIEGIQDKLMRYGGENGPLYLSRVRGLSPGQSADSLIKLSWVMDAIEPKDRSRTQLLKGPKALGVDVANSETGDKAAIAEGQGAVLLKVEDFQCPDANQLGKREVFTLMKEQRIRAEHIGIDSVGVGAGTVNALKELDVNAIALGGSDSPIDVGKEEEFYNLRSQMWWELREDLRNGEVILPNDTDLIMDLTAPKWENKNGKIVVESKETIKKRLGHSPNKGDAAVYWNWVRKNHYKAGSFYAEII